MRRNASNAVMGVFVAVVFGLAGCGGGGGDGATTATGKFVDAPVAGLKYISGSQQGVTDDTGNFTYEVGKTVKFMIGDIILGEATAQSVMTPISFAPAGSDATTPEVSARVQFLMSISTTDPTGTGKITIPAKASTVYQGKSINFATVTQAELLTTVKLSDANKTLSTQSAAQIHLSASVNQLFSGAYSGTYSGTSSGTWNMNIDNAGQVTGTHKNNSSSDSTGTLSGNMLTKLESGSKFVFGGTADDGTKWVGTLDITTGIFSGTWNNSSSNGTFTGNKK
jgi:hypothetical protein